jgi:hypothetical protein
MITIFEMPIESVNDATLRSFQQNYPSAVLRIETIEAMKPTKMDETDFWSIIALFDWKNKTGEGVMKHAIESLSLFSLNEIAEFYEILAEKLYQLDGKKYAVQLGSNRYAENVDNYFSVDDFLYSRCGVLARGKSYYLTVLENPARMPKEFTFEHILFLPHLAYKLKTGHDGFSHVTKFWYETFSNPVGWEGITPLKDLILEL